MVIVKQHAEHDFAVVDRLGIYYRLSPFIVLESQFQFKFAEGKSTIWAFTNHFYGKVFVRLFTFTFTFTLHLHSLAHTAKFLFDLWLFLRMWHVASYTTSLLETSSRQAGHILLKREGSHNTGNFTPFIAVSHIGAFFAKGCVGVGHFVNLSCSGDFQFLIWE